MNNQPRPNSENESQAEIDRTVELLESFNDPRAHCALDEDQQSLLEVASAARASVATQLPKPNQALRQQLIEAMANEATADVKRVVASRPTRESLPPRRWAASAVVVIGLGITGWFLSGFNAADFEPSQVAVMDASTETEVTEIKPAETEAMDLDGDAFTPLGSAVSTNSHLDDLLDISDESQVSATDGVTVPLPKLAEKSVSTIVKVPDGGTVVFGGIKIKKLPEAAQKQLAQNDKQGSARWEEGNESKTNSLSSRSSSEPIRSFHRQSLDASRRNVPDPDANLFLSRLEDLDSEEQGLRERYRFHALKQKLGDGYPTARMSKARLDRSIGLASSDVQFRTRDARKSIAYHESILPSSEYISGITPPASIAGEGKSLERYQPCLLYTSPSPRDQRGSRMPSSA